LTLPFQIFPSLVGTDTVETIPIDNALLSGNREPEAARLGIPWLGFRRDGPHLDEPKPHPQEASHSDAILVETGAQS
jgi:hypothetical protein